MSAAARAAVMTAFQADEDVSDVLNSMPPLPRSPVSVQQLETGTAHLRAALRLFREVLQREEPQYQEGDFEAEEA